LYVYLIRLAAFATLVVIAVAGTAPAIGQPVRSSSCCRAAIRNDHEERKNAMERGLVGGVFEGSFMRFAEEIRRVVDDNDEMRVLPIVSRAQPQTSRTCSTCERRRRPSPKSTSSSISVRSESFRTSTSASVSAALPGPSFDHAKRYYQHRATARQTGSISSTPEARRASRASCCFRGLGSTIKLVSGPHSGFEQLRKGEMTRSCAWFKSRSASLNSPRSAAQFRPAHPADPYSKKFTDLYAFG